MTKYLVMYVTYGIYSFITDYTPSGGNVMFLAFCVE